MLLIVIPARYASSRFPGKPLAKLGGRTMISRVYERCEEGARRAGATLDFTAQCQTVVATDDQRILDHVNDFGGRVMMTRPDHPSGTDRVAEVAAAFPAAEVILNVQGDEPFIDPDQIVQVAKTCLLTDTDVATLARKIDEERELLSPNVVKVVTAPDGRALYFSRHAIPYLRDEPVGQWILRGKHLQHLGIYGFRAAALHRITELAESPLEQNESLEQLRWLEAGLRIRVALTELPARGIDTPGDLARAEVWLAERG